jgi:hypothetical protein
VNLGLLVSEIGYETSRVGHVCIVGTMDWALYFSLLDHKRKVLTVAVGLERERCLMTSDVGSEHLMMRSCHRPIT